MERYSLLTQALKQLGQYTAWMADMLDMLIQPTIEGSLNDLFNLPDESIPMIHLDRAGPNLTTAILSHVVSGIITSPLDLIRTRLIAQTWSPSHRKYRGLADAWGTILKEEGWSAFYAAPNLTATIVYHTVRALFLNTTNLIIDRVFKISNEEQPILYALCELGLNTMELLVTLPLETVRRRLQVQNNSNVVPNESLETVVELRNRKYAGMLDCFVSIIEEEGGRRSRKRLRRASIINGAPSYERSGALVRISGDDSRPWWDGFGLKGLYRGLKAHLWGKSCSSVVVVTNQ
jgi:fusion and transport protein UGO1